MSSCQSNAWRTLFGAVVLMMAFPAVAQEQLAASRNEIGQRADWPFLDGFPSQELFVVEARWGASDGWADVTKVLRDQVKHGQLFVPDLSALLKDIKDPKAGHDKALVVVYHHQGSTRLKIVPTSPPTRKGGPLVLPETGKLTEQERNAFAEKLEGTKWRIVKDGSTLQFEDGKFGVSDWDDRRGAWLVTGTDRIQGLVPDGSHTAAVFDSSLETGTWSVNGEIFSKIVRLRTIEPKAALPDGPLFESVLGVYGHALRGKREPFVNLRPPHRDLWAKEIEGKLKGTLSYAEVDYIGSAQLIIPRTGNYNIDLPDRGTQLRLNGQLVYGGHQKLRQGAYDVEIYTNHWGQPYLKYAHAIVIEVDTKERVPFVNTGPAIEAFLSQKINGRVVTQVTDFKMKRVKDR